MHYEDRYKILKHIEKVDESSIHELAKLCNVSLPTIRKYLKILHDSKLLIFSRGIVKKNPKHETSLLGWRLDDNRDAKRIIGEKIGSIIQDRETIFLGGGSTVFFSLEYIVQKKDLTIVTNSLHVMNFLTKYDNISTICTGGNWNPRSHSFINFSKDYENFNPDRSFIGALAVSLERGVTQNQELMNADEFKMFSKANQKYIVADSKKFERSYPWSVLSSHDIDYIVTDVFPRNKQDWIDKNIIIL